MSERVILNCLETLPEARPKSAHTVASGLPGADPLAAALAAGETPSPELVAAAGELIDSRRWVTISALAGVFVCLSVVCWLAADTHVVNQTAVRDPAVLDDKAQELLRDRLEYKEPAVAVAHGFVTENGGLQFWYRQRNEAPFAVNSFWHGRWFSRGLPTFRAPPWDSHNELGLRLNAMGKLRFFRARGPRTAAANSKPVDSSKLPWEKWFPSDATGFDLARDSGDTTAVQTDADVTRTRGRPRSKSPAPRTPMMRYVSGRERISRVVKSFSFRRLPTGGSPSILRFSPRNGLNRNHHHRRKTWARKSGTRSTSLSFSAAVFWLGGIGVPDEATAAGRYGSAFLSSGWASSSGSPRHGTHLPSERSSGRSFWEVVRHCLTRYCLGFFTRQSSRLRAAPGRRFLSHGRGCWMAAFAIRSLAGISSSERSPDCC